jgi:pimeloyl-ACP methyl ester carboxylesterase
MDTCEPQFLEIGDRRRIAYRFAQGQPEKPGILWLSGFLSDMQSTKALAVADWAEPRRHAMLRFDYSGHGRSGGDLLRATIGDWLDEADAMFDLLGGGRRIVVGSSMGGWIALLLARRLSRQRRSGELGGLVLIAPAWDITEMLMWREFPEDLRAELMTNGVVHIPSAYDAPYPITRALIEEGRSHLLAGGGFDPDCPVRILQGYRDPDVPWRHALSLLDVLTGDDVEFTLVKQGDHRLSAPHDLERLISTIASLH